MNLQEKILKVWRRWSPELLIFAIFLGFGFWINRGVELKGLYMDDLYLWSCYGNQSFTEYVFPMGSSRFRFLFYLASWLELFFIGGHVEWMVPFNIILNTGIAYSIYRMAVSFSDGRRIISFAVGIQNGILSDRPVLRSDGEPGALGSAGDTVVSVPVCE